MKGIHHLTGQPLLYFTSIFVSLGVFLFGYDQGVMSGIITGPYFKEYFNHPTRAQIGTMVAILEVGAFVSSLLVGRIGDIIGRRRTIFFGALVFVVGGSLQTFAQGMPSMVMGRIVAGFGVGMLSTIVPVYQSEISPSHNRGRLACIEFTGNIVGYSSSVWVDYACSFIESDMSWRIPLFIQCVMGFLLLLGSLVIVETPRWLLDNDHDEEGIITIGNLHGDGNRAHPKAIEEYKNIKESVLIERFEGERSYSEMWRKYKRRVLIAMSSQMFAQLNGINVISYYAPLVFEQAGWIGRDAILMTGINSVIYVFFTIPPWYLTDLWGRRVILLSGAAIMAVSLSMISYFMYIEVPQTPTMVVLLVMIYNGFFGYSWGPIPWLYPPEILPLSVRAKGASLSTASNWFFNWLVGEVTPILQEAITWRLYLVHAFFCVCSFIAVYFTYPETKGVTLEDMDAIFGDYSATPSFVSGYLNVRSDDSNGFASDENGHDNGNVYGNDSQEDQNNNDGTDETENIANYIDKENNRGRLHTKGVNLKDSSTPILSSPSRFQQSYEAVNQAQLASSTIITSPFIPAVSPVPSSAAMARRVLEPNPIGEFRSAVPGFNQSLPSQKTTGSSIIPPEDVEPPEVMLDSVHINPPITRRLWVTLFGHNNVPDIVNRPRSAPAVINSETEMHYGSPNQQNVGSNILRTLDSGHSYRELNSGEDTI